MSSSAGDAHGDNAAAKPLNIAIVGGGIAGLCLLLGILHNCGSPSSSGSRRTIVPHVYEAVSAFSEIGAGIGFGPNAVSAMASVDPRLHDAYYRIAADAVKTLEEDRSRAVWHEFYMGVDGRGLTGGSRNGESVTDNTKVNMLKAGDKIGEVYWRNRKKQVHRARFLDEMVRLLPGGTGEGFVTFNKRVTDVEGVDSPDTGIKLHFADGTSTEVDAVVGCDGVKSRIRQVLLAGRENCEPRFTGKYAYRGLVPMDEAVKALGEEMARKSHMFWGYGGHFVDFPIEMGKTLNVVAFHTKGNGKWDNGSQWVVPSTSEEVMRDFQDWSPPVRALVSLLKNPDKWGLFDHPPASTYHKGGKICLLGDCAHASTPHQGAAAGMAIEDAAVLSMLLKNIGDEQHSPLEKVFHAYDAVRRPRTHKLVSTSRGAGELYDFQAEGIWDDEEKLYANMKTRMDWIWDLDLDKHFEDALRIMNGYESTGAG